MADEITLSPKEEAALTKSTRRLMFYLVGIYVFALGGFWWFMEWTTDIHQRTHRFIPFWKFPEHHIQREWREVRMAAVSSIEIDPDHWIHVSIDSTVEGPGGSLRLVPEVFRSGVVYGISACHPQGQQSDDGFNRAKNAELLQELQDMWPQPSAIWRRVSQTPPIASASTSTPTFWKDDGFAVAFDTASVEAERGLLFLARSFGQAAVYKWWPHIWSFHPVDDATLMQGVVPVASGLSHMRYELPAYVVDGATTQLLPDAHTAPDRDEL